MAILNRFCAILLYCDSTYSFASRCGISGDSGPASLGIMRFTIRDSVLQRWGGGGVTKGGGGVPHSRERYNVCPQGCRDIRTVTRVRHPLLLLLGACAMTTKFLDNKICTFRILLSWRSHKNKPLSVFGRFSSLPPKPPPPPQKRKFYFYCRLAVSYLCQRTTKICATIT